MSRRKASQELTREMILKEARSQFENKDFQQVSMRCIAKSLNCSHGAIYYHFKNKADLFYTVVEEEFAQLNTLLETIVQGNEDNEEKLRKVFFGFIEFGLNHQSQYEIMFLNRNSEIDTLAQEFATVSYQKFASTVQGLFNQPLLMKDIYSAFIALHGFVSHYRGYVQSYDEAKEAATSYVSFLMKGLSSH